MCHLENGHTKDVKFCVNFGTEINTWLINIRDQHISLYITYSHLKPNLIATHQSNQQFHDLFLLKQQLYICRFVQCEQNVMR